MAVTAPVTLLATVTMSNADEVTPRASPLADRLEFVCRIRNLTERSWSLAAGLSDKYLAVQRNRAAEDQSYVLPEKAAVRLAEHARVSVEWLRFGHGEAPEQGPPVETGSDVDLAFLDAFGRGGYSSEDGVAARRLIEQEHLALPSGREAAARAVRYLLAAVAAVRREGRPVTTTNVMSAVIAARASQPSAPSSDDQESQSQSEDGSHKRRRVGGAG